MEVVCVGYSHSWQLNRENFTESFLDDVKCLLLDFVAILQDIKVNHNGISFNGRGNDGCETFVLKPKWDNWCKTACNRYDEPVTAILLLSRYHFGDELELASSGLCNIYINERTLEVGGYWEEAISYLKEKFGYKFERSYGLDEHGNEAIILKPLININTSNIQHKTKTIILSKLQDEYNSIGKSLSDLEKESENKEIIDIIYNKTRMFQNYLCLIKDSEKK